MSGVVTDSQIVSSITVGGMNGKYQQHRITIAPFSQEMRRDTSVWGQLLDFTVVMATTSNLGMSFVTKGDVQSAKYSSCKLQLSFLVSVSLLITLVLRRSWVLHVSCTYYAD